MKIRNRVQPLAFVVLAFIISFILRSANLQNDDLQIYFMLLNGGDVSNPIGCGLYTNYLLGWCISQLSYLLPFLNVYLLYLFVLSFLACYCANEYVFRSISGWNARSRWIVWILLLLINISCLINLQYTHVAIWAAMVGLLQLSLIRTSDCKLLRGLATIVLMSGAFMLRESALVPLAFFSIPFIWCGLKNKYTQLSICGVLVLLVSLYGLSIVAYQRHPEWNDAKTFLQTRVKILDSADNSGINKSGKLQSAGIDPESFALFKSFVYTPSMDNMEKITQGLAIHREGRKGLMGSKMLADMGILEAPLSARLKSSLTFFQRLTPWVPLGLMLFLWGVGYSKRGVWRVCSMVVCLAAYVSVLLLLQRMVGRVLDPVLYAAAVWMMAQPTEENNVNRQKWVAAACGIIGLLGCLFFVRHWRVSPRTTPAQDYCAAHPDTLYLTTCQQGLGLYPTGFCGYSYEWLKRANILPIADGWNYYTPAYRAALASHGFSSFQDAFFHPRTLIVIREGSLKVTDTLKRLAACEWGKKIECSVVHTHAGFHFVKVEVKEAL